MEITFPVELLISGVPVSLQGSSNSLERWKDRIRDELTRHVDQPYFLHSARIAITIFYFPEGPMVGDVDNIVKPILDAFERHVYLNDRQVERVLVQKFEPSTSVAFRSPSPTLVDALLAVRPILYIKISDDPSEGLS